MALDLIIIGGGAGGATAGIYAARNNLKFKIICKEFGGEVVNSWLIENYPGIEKIPGLELSKIFRKQLDNYSVEIEEGVLVKDIKKDNGVFLIEVEKDGERADYQTKTIIIATGVKPKALNVEGEQEFKNKGLTYCTVCDGPLFKGKKIAVIGGGNSALDSIIMLSSIANEVIAINKNPKFKGDEILINKLKSLPNVKVIYNALTQKIIGDKFVSNLEYKDLLDNSIKKIDVEGIFVHVGMAPTSDFINIIDKNEYGEIKINGKCETSTPGIFAVGDVADVPFKQLAIAVGHGAVAALSATEYLNKLQQ